MGTENITLNDIPDQYEDLAEFLGTKVFVEFCKYFGGSYVYIPTEKTLFNSIRNKEIINMYENGTTIKDIAKRFNLTHNAIKQIVKKNKPNDYKGV